jgi:hypothetical protein
MGVSVSVGCGGSVGTTVAAGGDVRVGVGVGVAISKTQPLSVLEMSATVANPAAIHIKTRNRLLCSV